MWGLDGKFIVLWERSILFYKIVIYMKNRDYYRRGRFKEYWEIKEYIE